MNDWVNRRWYAITELSLVFTCGVLMIVLPEARGWLLLVSLLPGLGRLLMGMFPFKATRLDLPMALFFITACGGIWVAYDRTAALAKFWLLAQAVLLFYILSRQPPQNWRLVTGLIIALDFFLVSWFLLTYDWRSSPTEFNLFNRVGIWWENIRPDIVSGSLQADKAGDLIATFVPFILVSGLYYLRTRRWLGFLLSMAVSGFVLFGLLLTSSITSWLALIVAFGVWLFWRLHGILVNRFPQKKSVIYGMIILLVTAGIASTGLVFSRKNLFLANLHTGTNISIGRLELATDTIRLVNDYPFTGGGLAAFSGQYSRYILDIPYFFFNHSHNIFLDVVFEQSPVGLLAFLALLGGSFRLLLTNRQKSPLWWAVFTSLIVVIIQGLADDPLYGGGGTPLLFILTGLAVALSNPIEAKRSVNRSMTSTTRKRLLWISSSGLFISVILIYLLWPFLIAHWYANLGAIYMAKVELTGFPNGKWNEKRNIPALAVAEEHFHKSLSVDTSNFTAQYRSALIDMLAEDFEAAQVHLERALAIQPGHRGVRKQLGYGYLWTGNLGQAVPLLASLPEVSDELIFYSWWWRTQGKEDLAGRAEFMLQEINRTPPDHTP